MTTKKEYRISFTKKGLCNILKCKNPDSMLKDAEKNGLKKTLTAFDLIILGIGVIIGSGIFAVVGIAAAGSAGSPGAGPALVISMIIATLACIFSALCYCEFAAMIPVAGGAYVYTFATLGEFMAWMVGWVLMLEYGIGYIAVACAWSNHFMQFLKGFENYLPQALVNPPAWLVSDYNSIIAQYSDNASSVMPHIFGIPIAINIPAIAIILLITWILKRGTKDSTLMATLMVAIKLLVIALFVIVGAFYVKPENWVPFAPNGFDGILSGAFIIFFAYIGFDALATTAEECKNPQRDLPIGIIGSLLITTIVYISVALVLTGMQPTSGVEIPQGFLKAPMAYVMTMVHQDWVSGFISVGSLAGLTSVLLVLQMAATRILYAMSRDNFLPPIFRKLNRKTRTPNVLTYLVAGMSIIGVLTLDLNAAAELCNFGTFTSFIIVCVAVLILRKIDPDRYRPFKVPFSPLFPILGIVCCGGLMVYFLLKSASVMSSVLFPIWLGIGALIYFHYGYKKNRKKEARILEIKNRVIEKLKMKELEKNAE
ncbi:amino acid permease [bacterium]|nr:amino acid permease [bacterium]